MMPQRKPSTEWLAAQRKRYTPRPWTCRWSARCSRWRDAMGLRFEVPVITVAGTNGKGSHLLDDRVASRAVRPATAWGCTIKPRPGALRPSAAVSTVRPSMRPTPWCADFEAVEAGARRYGAHAPSNSARWPSCTLAVARADMDLVILEVGLGGRYDSGECDRLPTAR